MVVVVETPVSGLPQRCIVAVVFPGFASVEQLEQPRARTQIRVAVLSLTNTPRMTNDLVQTVVMRCYLLLLQTTIVISLLLLQFLVRECLL